MSLLMILHFNAWMIFDEGLGPFCMGERIIWSLYKLLVCMIIFYRMRVKYGRDMAIECLI